MFDNVTLSGTHEFLQGPSNIFNVLPLLAAPKPTELCDELDRYLSTNPEHTANVLGWWYERCGTFPQLSHMALDYLSILGKSLSSSQRKHADYLS